MPFKIKYEGSPLYIMEICGTHTMAIARAALRACLPPNVHLISGPGCPVCVTPSGAIDAALELADQKDVMICSYGDLLRVPGADQQTLLQKKAQGKDVRICLSIMDALQLARSFPKKEVVFLGVGFETTAPGTAVAIQQAETQNCMNFSLLNLLKCTEPAIRAILTDPECKIDAFLCPGHVAAITGEKGFSFLTDEYQKNGVICGFEPEDLLYAIQLLCDAQEHETKHLINTYTRLVRPLGNQAAIAVMDEVFERTDSDWRGLGTIAQSGLSLRKKYEKWDAAKKFQLAPFANIENAGCCCGQVLKGKMRPQDCPLFRVVCTPQTPIGPCMVSSEGSCAAAERYE